MKIYQKLAKDINVEATILGRILDGKEQFGKTIAFRLEAHSGEIIPAIDWWRLAKKEEEQSLLPTSKERKMEQAKVTHQLYRKKLF